MLDSPTLGGDYRILFVNFLGLSGGGQQVKQFFEPQTFDEPPSVVNQIYDNYFYSQVVNQQPSMCLSDRPVVDDCSNFFGNFRVKLFLFRAENGISKTIHFEHNVIPLKVLIEPLVLNRLFLITL